MIGATCVNCQQPTLPNALFCHHCGTRVESRCPGCGSANPPDAAFCQSCSINLRAAGQPAAGPQYTGTISFCPRCQATNDFNARFCYKCGLPLEQAGVIPVPVPAAEPGALLGPAGERIGVPAGFWIRLAAQLLDGILIAIVAAIVASLLGIEIDQGGFSLPDLLEFRRLDALNNVLSAVYVIIGWSAFGTTLGKRAFNMYVVQPDGSRIGVWRAILRYVGYYISILTLLIGYLMVAFRKDKRSLHDLIAGTYVVIRKR